MSEDPNGGCGHCEGRHPGNERRLAAGLLATGRRVRDPAAAAAPRWASGKGKNGPGPPSQSAGQRQPTAPLPVLEGGGTGCTSRGTGRQPT
jgi:hypothetical protein